MFCNLLRMFSNPIYNFIFNIAISLIIIILCHYSWTYLKDTYSTKKTKDLVGIQTEKYKRMFSEIQHSKSMPNNNSENTIFINAEEKQTMNDDLLSYANSLQ